MKYLYILMFVSLWSLGLFVLFHRTRTTLWIGLTLFLGGFASFAFAMHLTLIPLIGTDWMPVPVSFLLYGLTVIAMHIHFYLLPYVFSMGGLWLNETISVRRKQLLSILLFLGTVALLAQHLILEPWNSFHVALFRWWDGLYVALGCFFYGLANFREKNELRRTSRRQVLLFPVIMVWAYASDYVGFDSLKLGWWSFDLQSNGMWQSNFIAILGAVYAILFFIVRYGFLGVKLRIERERIDYSIRTLTMGVAILNHSIKNEIQKIDYLAEKSITLIHTGQSEKAIHSLEKVHGLTAHLHHMVNRIKEKAEDVVLDESENEVREIIDPVIASSRTLMEEGPLSIFVRYEAEGVLKCDPVHIRETLSNLIRNAMDALPHGGGTIELLTTATRREFRVEVKDNGEGIPPEHLAKIVEPFFTTKKNTLNYGLGLSYCNSVMSKHGGRLAVAESVPGKGTTMVLHFPVKRFKARVPSLTFSRESKRLDPLNPS
ncbi:sensor histidine kinase [Gorillibacterium timonense]|uniref:sensor histidine kinase n=1 Tax=Gorillibacterium timonense TaxID=1689269 RepID=UPI00071D6663|nr:HAMP domain-containing sensor histidine kinase [Gorillibacterium timonense]